MGEKVGHDPAQGEGDEFGVGDGVGKYDGGFGCFVFVGFEWSVGSEAARGVALLDATGNGIEDFDAFVGVLADACLAGKHDAVDLLDDGVEDVGDFGPGGDWIFDHAFEHLGGDDDFSTVVGASFNNVALDDGEVFNGAFATEVAAGDHDATGGFDDGIDVIEGLLVFDFSDDAGFAAFLFEEELQVLDVAGFASEREGDEVDAEFDAEIEVEVVFGGERGESDGDTWEVDVAAGAHFALGGHLTEDTAVTDREDFHLDKAAIDVDDIAGLEVHAKVGVVHVNGVGNVRWEIGFGAEFDVVSHVQLPGCFEVARADRRAGEIHQDGNVFACAFGGLAYVLVDRAGPIM